MGTIRKYEKKDGSVSWHAEVRWRGSEPKRASFRKKEDAEAWMENIQSSINDEREEIRKTFRGCVKTPLSFFEREIIEARLKAGHSCSQISRELKRGKNTVVAEVRKNGGKDLYEARKAEAMQKEILQKGHEKTASTVRANPPIPWMKQRIENLEMQIEILSETIKEILKK
jgi:hypothetical protein